MTLKTSLKLTSLMMLVSLSGCASWIQGFFPELEPVTASRCQKLDLKQLGFKDAEIGQRTGDKFDFWKKDCLGAGVTLDRAAYDAGYSEGLKIYCSCEKGFASGVRDEFTEMRGQYYSCTRPEYAVFLKGHTEGKKFSQDLELMKKDGPYRMNYFDEIIQKRALKECASLKSGSS